MTPLQAAKKVRDAMVKAYGESEDLVVWNKEKCAQQSCGGVGEAALVWEGGPEEWAINVSMSPAALSLPGILAEPYNSFILNFYNL